MSDKIEIQVTEIREGGVISIAFIQNENGAWELRFRDSMGQLDLERPVEYLTFTEAREWAGKLLSSRACLVNASSRYCPVVTSNGRLSTRIDSYRKAYLQGTAHIKQPVEPVQLVKKLGPFDTLQIGDARMALNYREEVVLVDFRQISFAMAAEFATALLSIKSFAEDYYVEYLKCLPTKCWYGLHVINKFDGYLVAGGRKPGRPAAVVRTSQEEEFLKLQFDDLRDADDALTLRALELEEKEKVAQQLLEQAQKMLREAEAEKAAAGEATLSALALEERVDAMQREANASRQMASVRPPAPKAKNLRLLQQQQAFGNRMRNGCKDGVPRRLQ